MTCASGKIVFPSAQRAEQALRAIARKKHDSKHPLFAYPCAPCRGWHLTSAQPKGRALTWPHLE